MQYSGHVVCVSRIQDKGDCDDRQYPAEYASARLDGEEGSRSSEHHFVPEDVGQMYRQSRIQHHDVNTRRKTDGAKYQIIPGHAIAPGICVCGKQHEGCEQRNAKHHSVKLLPQQAQAEVERQFESKCSASQYEQECEKVQQRGNCRLQLAGSADFGFGHCEIPLKKLWRIWARFCKASSPDAECNMCIRGECFGRGGFTPCRSAGPAGVLHALSSTCRCP